MSALLAVSPALAPGKAAPYVAGAYVVFIALLLVYVTIMATRLARAERDVVALNRDIAARESPKLPGPPPTSEPAATPEPVR